MKFPKNWESAGSNADKKQPMTNKNVDGIIRH
jgi:hypothetical protein